MSWYDSTPIPSFKKEYVHDLGFKPIVIAYVNLASIDEGTGWKQIPFVYSNFVWPGPVITIGTIDFYHEDDNTVVFTAPEDAEIVADILIDPQHNAWYE